MSTKDTKKIIDDLNFMAYKTFKGTLEGQKFLELLVEYFMIIRPVEVLQGENASNMTYFQAGEINMIRRIQKMIILYENERKQKDKPKT